jgi:ssDNA-binding Zn-finger/Zn-ribbon topoisomerase 1
MARMVKCPECGEVFKEPLIKEKRHGIGINFPGMPGAITCPKCKYKSDSSVFPNADSVPPAPK